MKTRKLNFLKIGILFFGITILLWNCEKEEFEKEVVKKGNYSVSKINFSDIKQNTQLIQKLEKFSKKKKKEEINDTNTQNKDVYSSEYDFTINTDFINFVESRKGNYHSYTFPIEREIDNGLVENLLVSLKKDGSYDFSLISYNITQQEKLKLHYGEQVDLNNKVDIIKINNVLDDYFSKTMYMGCADIGVSSCAEGNHPGGVSNGVACPAQSISYYRVCNVDRGGPAGNNSEEEEYGEDYLDNRGGGGGGASDPEDDPEEEEEEIRISAVVFRKICDDDGGKVYNETTKNCECPKGMVENNSGKCVKKPCVGDPVANVEIASSGKSGKKGGTFGCTRKDSRVTCGGIKGDRKHSGLDVKAAINTNTFSMYDGKVSDIRNSFSPGQYKNGSLGNYIQVTTRINGETVFIKYNHLNQVNVKKGDIIKAGDVIGLNGNTGNANPPDDDIIPHIHFQVFNTQWESINPLDFLTTKFDNEFNPISNDCK